ncbi:MAG: glutamate racemase [Chlamydiae bacterium]|nr:glutamate racemase [Chlamydiota bacterium]
MLTKDLPIGIFDSGLGGLTVMQEIIKLLPNENLIYFGDSAHLPYGNKSQKNIIRYSLANAKFLQKQKVKVIVVACNSASAYALDALKKELDLPVIGVIAPGFFSLMQATKNFKVAVLGTRATINSNIYQKLILQKHPKASFYPIACPLFVPLVEEGLHKHHLSSLHIHEYLQPLKDKNIDAVLLACTHYPLLKELIQNYLGKKVLVIDPAIATAHALKELLEEQKLLTSKKSSSYKFFVTDDAKKFKILGQNFLGMEIKNVKEIEPL